MHLKTKHIGLVVGICLSVTVYSQREELVRHIQNYQQSKSPPIQSIFDEFPTQAEIVMVGDSLTRMGLWSEFFPGCQVANRGIGGDTSTRVLQRAASILDVQAGQTFIMIGYNDLKEGVDVQKVLRNYDELTTVLASRGSQIYILSTLNCSATPCESLNKTIDHLNSQLKRLATSKGARYIDLNETMADKKGLRRELTYDGTHLNGSGYRIWVEGIETYLPEHCLTAHFP